LQEIIGGKLSHEIISLENDYPYYGEREEAYLTLNIEIKNKKNIQEALDLYVKDDILEGENKYYCEKYDRRIKVKKRCCIQTLPNNLIITLKRFEFDLETMMKMKINDFFEFPKDLNLKKWSKQGIQEQEKKEKDMENEEDLFPDYYFEYKLVGILVHSGNSESGHYYSYIQNTENPSGKWYEFNDTYITEFSPKDINAECFGGEYEKNNNF